MEEYPTKRDLDGVYFRVQRDGEYVNRCFTDLTEEEQKSIMGEYDSEWLMSLCVILARVVRNIGDAFNIVNAETDGEEDE